MLSANLPAQLTSFIGREGDLSELSRLLQMSRLVTLTGAGGSGKSRLALELAPRQSNFPDGIYLAELAPLSDPTLVPQLVATALGMVAQPAGGTSLALADFLRSKHLLLILDNCEHLIEACAHLVDVLLRAAPDLRVLATSREALGVTGEIHFSVPPLASPDPDELPPMDKLLQFDAIRLFVDRARAVRPAFHLSDSNAQWVARICARLDGIPLALELAAARMKYLSPEEIAARLDDRFQLLTGGSRTELPRHQTLRAAIDWSFELLAEEERVLLARLGVFVGGWSLGASEAVCGPGVLDALSQLVNKSLVTAEPGEDETRFGMLETIRQYALERLGERGELDTYRQRHREFFFNLIREGGGDIFWFNGGTDWLDRVESDLANIRAALAWAIVCGNPDEVLVVLGLLSPLWTARHYHWEAGEWYQRLLPLATPGTPIYEDALLHLGEIVRMNGDPIQARRLIDQAIEAGQARGDDVLVAHCFTQLGQIAWDLGDAAGSIHYHEQALAMMRKRPFDFPPFNGLYFLAQTKYWTGDTAGARPLLEEGLASARRVGNSFMIGWGLGAMSELAFRERRFGEAIRLSKESLALKLRIRDRAGVFYTFETLASIALEQGDGEVAARLLGAAERLRERLHFPMSRFGQEELARRISRALGPIDRAPFERARAEGRTMSQEQAVEYALQISEASDELPAGRAAKADFGGLTARERQVAILIGEGKSNREIAEELVVGIKTVEAHVTRILDKLGFASRSQIAGWVVSKGLARPPEELDANRE